MSVTRCVVRAAVDDRTVQAGNSDYDAAQRLIALEGSPGYLYVGDNLTAGLYPVAELDLNGGEQVLVEAQQTYQYGVTDGAGQTPVGVATALGITSFDDNGQPAIDVPDNGVAGLNGVVPDDVVAVLSGRGAGQYRRVTAVDVTTNADGSVESYVVRLDRPWDVAPALSDTVSVSHTPAHVAVFRNTLGGDGIRSRGPGASDAGVEVSGVDVAVDDNDVSGLFRGMDVGADESLSDDPFDVHARNSFHGNGVGVFVSAYWNQGHAPHGAVGPAAGYFAGDVFRDDAVSGTPGTAFEVAGNLAFAPASVAAEAVLPVFDRCTVVDARFAFSFECSRPRSGTGLYDPGVLLATVADRFAAGPGTPGSAAVTRSSPGTSFPGVAAGADPMLLANPFGDQWQGFDVNYGGF